MRPSIVRALQIVPILLASALLAACNPAYNWRDYTSEDGRFKVLFPAKPATLTRTVDLNGLHVEMTMTAAKVDNTTFAVGTGVAPDPARAQAALPAMRLALLRNIGAPDAAATDDLNVDITGAGQGAPMHLSGRFAANGNRFYQVIVLGPAGKTPPEQVEQFLTSFTRL
ncbi:hypothetical protein RCH14_000977 [Massilia sp. MP_M2]|uniref:hypothetical protein n=1 Tax=Massilia sp. MP_M2 TaxID=3071713 RepID=UPI00319EA286